VWIDVKSHRAYSKKRPKTEEMKKSSNKKPGGESPEDISQSTGKDFEFLITGDINISAEDFEKVMTPRSFEWTMITKKNWPYFQVGQDEFSYSWEPPGIQMTFNKEMPYQKAKKIADEVVENIRATGQNAKLIVLDSTKVHRFDS
jgi:hypothetical protein